MVETGDPFGGGKFGVAKDRCVGILRGKDVYLTLGEEALQ